jgi:hypothetical protein
MRASSRSAGTISDQSAPMFSQISASETAVDRDLGQLRTLEPHRQNWAAEGAEKLRERDGKRPARIGAADEKALGARRPLHRAPEDQRLDLVVELAALPLMRARVAGRHLAQHHDHRILPRLRKGEIEQGLERRQVAAALVVGRDIGRDVDDVALGEQRRFAGEAHALAVGREQIVEPRLHHRQPPLAERLRECRIRRKPDRREAFARGCDP